MTFVGIDTVVYAADDVKLARRFFTDWGLEKTKATISNRDGLPRNSRDSCGGSASVWPSCFEFCSSLQS